ncbi:MAG: hypothetical protein LBS29_04965 [Endomicrobium sp.]|jgi:hypothetical protein|nr:hypothetical protein [Endomicrobium sp.]
MLHLIAKVLECSTLDKTQYTFKRQSHPDLVRLSCSNGVDMMHEGKIVRDEKIFQSLHLYSTLDYVLNISKRRFVSCLYDKQEDTYSLFPVFSFPGAFTPVYRMTSLEEKFNDVYNKFGPYFTVNRAKLAELLKGEPDTIELGILVQNIITFKDMFI